MENKKSFLSTFLLMFVLVLIVVIGYMVYNLHMQNKNLENTMNRLEEKIDSISIITNSNENAEVNTSNSNDNLSNEVTTFSDDKIKTALTNYLNIFKGYGSIEGILESLELLKSGEYSNSELTSDNYRKTNIKYSNFKNTVMNYMTEDWFNTFNETGSFTRFKNIDGLLYYNDVGLTGSEYVVDSFVLKGDYSDSRYIAKVYSINPDDSKNWENIEFEITNYNGNCVISYCD